MNPAKTIQSAIFRNPVRFLLGATIAVLVAGFIVVLTHNYRQLAKKAHWGQVKSTLHAIYLAEDSAFRNHGTYSDDLVSLGINLSSEPHQFSYSITLCGESFSTRVFEATQWRVSPFVASRARELHPLLAKEECRNKSVGIIALAIGALTEDNDATIKILAIDEKESLRELHGK